MVNTLLAKLHSLDARFKAIDPCRYVCWLLLPSSVVVLTLAPALYFWGFDGPFRPLQFPQATIIWALSLPLAFFSYEGLVVTWRARLTLRRKLVFSLWHLFAIALSLVPIVTLIMIVRAIGGANGDR
jgi:hypothetical protein